ncbi:hypothetical protein CAPTEDRAFT_207194 [Capitella teleta]|uniref:Multidrug and toxin extrusion protein n=1 Tax=Capitella teleta TaxID=283909 RepID=R7T6Z4_CAPTE|nr:hypothetical protein CAPTEDRAFT_207194 [Capitella teleta]|eukprot:ELT89320.1 hypothetical protein CAPTEDRAFT_207194 [Capitella teleta]
MDLAIGRRNWLLLACTAVPWLHLLPACHNNIPVISVQMLSFFFEVTIYPATVIFGGHLGTEELAAIGLANSIQMTLVAGIAYGIAQVCDTYFAQVYGKGNYPYLLVVAQRGMVIFFLVAICLVSIVINFEQIFRFLGQNSSTSRLAGNYLLICAPCIPKERNVVLVLMTLNQIINALLHLILCYHTPLGLYGSALAQNLGMLITFIGLLVYNFKTPVGSHWTGRHGEVLLSAQVIGINLVEMMYMMVMGFGSASSILIGGYLGAGEPHKAKRATIIAGVVSVLGVCCQAACMVAFRYQIPRIFTKDLLVINKCAELMPYMAFYSLTTGINTVIRGIFRGVNRILSCSIILFLTQYVIAIPLILLLISYTGLRIKGVWLGFSLGALCGVIAYGVYMYYTFNYQKLSLEAEVLATGGRGKIHSTLTEDDKAPLLGTHSPMLRNRCLIIGGVLALLMAAIILRLTVHLPLNTNAVNVTQSPNITDSVYFT